MINAKEARARTDNSKKMLMDHLERISELIKAAADKGESFVEPSLGDKVCSVSQEVGGKDPDQPVMVRMITERLLGQGYKVHWHQRGSRYVPRGLQDDYDQSGPEWHTFGIVVSW